MLRLAGSLSCPRQPLSRGSDPASRPAKPLVSYQTHRHLSGWNLPPLEKRACRAHTGAQIGEFSTGFEAVFFFWVADQVHVHVLDDGHVSRPVFGSQAGEAVVEEH